MLYWYDLGKVNANLIKVDVLKRSSALRKNTCPRKINAKELRYNAVEKTLSPLQQNTTLYQLFKGFIDSTKQEFLSDFKDIYKAIKNRDLKTIKINKRSMSPILFGIAAGAAFPLVPGSTFGGYIIGKLTVVAYDKLILQFNKYKSGQCKKEDVERAYKELKQAIQTDTKKIKK